MTITGIISQVGEPRTFEVPAATGGKKKITTREIVIYSGNNCFVADAYDDYAAPFDNIIKPHDAVVAELRFDAHTVNTKDGNTFLQQQATLTAVQLIGEPLNTHTF